MERAAFYSCTLNIFILLLFYFILLFILFILLFLNKQSKYRFLFPACSATAKTTLCGHREGFIHCHGIPHSIASDKEIHFTAKE